MSSAQWGLAETPAPISIQGCAGVQLYRCAKPSSGLAQPAMRKLALALTCLSIPVAAAGHVTVWPRQSELGAYEKYAVRVPNEKQVATVRVEARFPPEIRVTSFQDVPGWRVEPRRDASGRIVGAAWVGSLPPERFVEFPLIAVNPQEGGDLTWSFIQLYQDGTKVEWTGAAGSKAPASIVELMPATPRMHH